jgi:hypothetical protein
MSGEREQDHASGHVDDGWAEPVRRLTVKGMPAGARSWNVAGREVTGPLQGFGQLWQKTYWVRLSGTPITPAEVIATWKDNFGTFWPPGNAFYGAHPSLTPGDVAVINTAPLGLPVYSTGILVVYVDDESFAFMTPRGHMFCALITFSTFAKDGATVAQVQPLIRTNDPIIEFFYRLGIGPAFEDGIWRHTLKALAAHFGVDAEVQQQTSLIDPRLQWRAWTNVWYNAAIWSGVRLLATPFRLAGGLARGRTRREQP